MPILQHYFTSFANKQTGNAGFQVKAFSPELPPDAQALITRLIAYRIPVTCDERDIQTHPIALRYYYENTQRCYLLCSQSNGADDNGRPGNFFAHTLILKPDNFQVIPPILYWGSSFWRKEDSSTSSELAPLSPDRLEYALEAEDIVWDFLAQGKRLDYFTRLMSAVIYANKTRRRIVIIDSAEHVAYWIAAVSLMLPIDHRPLLSFATYHHDPYQSQFLITGTTSDSSFRSSAEEYMTFFVLNTEQDHVSEIDISPYASKAREAAKSQQKYTEMMVFLQKIHDEMLEANPPECIDESLDQFISFTALASTPDAEMQPHHDIQSRQIDAIDGVLTRFEQATQLSEKNLQDLIQVSENLQNAWGQSPESSAGETRLRIAQLLKKYRQSTAHLVISDLCLTTEILLNSHARLAQSDLQWMQRTYGISAVHQAINSSDYWKWLTPILNANSDVQKVTSLWTFLGASLKISSESPSRVLLLDSLQRLGDLWYQRQTEAAGQLLRAILSSEINKESLLTFTIHNNEQLAQHTLLLLYLQLVVEIDIKDRKPYRDLMRNSRLVGNIAQREMIAQLKKTKKPLSEKFTVLEDWITVYARTDSPDDVAGLIDTGLRFLHDLAKKNDEEEWNRLAPRILTSKALVHNLPAHWESDLVQKAIASISLSQQTPANLALCQKYRKRQDILDQDHIKMLALLAMDKGQPLDDTASAELLETYLKPLAERDRAEYASEVKSYLEAFLKRPITADAHRQIVNATFSWSYADGFWESYWEIARQIFFDTNQYKQFSRILACWFATREKDFSRDYLPQYFFLNLPGKLKEWQEKQRGAVAAAKQINAFLEGRKVPWQPLIQGYLVKDSVFASAGQNVLGIIRRVSNAQNKNTPEEQELARATADNVARLFNTKHVLADHQTDFSRIYQAEKPKQFWEAYWEQLIDLFLHKDPKGLLDVLEFWFQDISNRDLEQQDYLIPTFFLGLNTAIDNAKRERGDYIRSARAVEELVSSKTPAKSWYPFFSDFFTM